VSGDLEGLGDAMNVNQGLLNALGLSSLAIEEMVARLRTAGALGAKLTGAGGDGGAVIGLFREPEPVVMKLRKAGIDCFASQLAGPEAL
jgi:mevalonate kinase